MMLKGVRWWKLQPFRLAHRLSKKGVPYASSVSYNSISFAGVQPVKPLSLARRRSTSKSLHKSGTSMTLNKHGSLSSLHAKCVFLLHRSHLCLYACSRGDDSERCQPIKVIRVEVKGIINAFATDASILFLFISYSPL